MKKVVLFLLLFGLFITTKSQTIEWHLADTSLPMIMLNEDLEPIMSDTNIFPAMYEVIRVIHENGNYITYSQGKDSLVITMLCQVAGFRVTCRVIKTPTRLIIQDGIIKPKKCESEEYGFSPLENTFECSILYLLLLLPTIKFRKHEHKN